MDKELFNMFNRLNYMTNYLRENIFEEKNIANKMLDDIAYIQETINKKQKQIEFLENIVNKSYLIIQNLENEVKKLGGNIMYDDKDLNNYASNIQGNLPLKMSNYKSWLDIPEKKEKL